MKLKIRKVLLLVCASVFLLLLYNSAKSLDPDTDHRGYSRPIEATSPVPSDIKDVPTCIGNQSRAINQILTSQLMKEISTYETEVSVLSDRSMIIFLVSAPKNVLERNFIRSTWGRSEFQNKYKFQIIFLVGQVPNKDYKPPDQEQFQDIVIISDLMESYRNLTLKTLSLFYYAKTRISANQNLVLVKLDDDVVVDIDNFMKKKKKMFSAKNFPPKTFICRTHFNDKPIRDPAERWYTSVEEYGEETWPTFCDGPVYFFGPKLAHDVINVIRPGETCYVWLEDVCVTGILGGFAGAKYSNLLDRMRMFSKDISHPTTFQHFRGEGSFELMHSHWDEVAKKRRINPVYKKL